MLLRGALLVHKGRHSEEGPLNANGCRETRLSWESALELYPGLGAYPVLQNHPWLGQGRGLSPKFTLGSPAPLKTRLCCKDTTAIRGS